jgi:hypothetical protein
VPGHYAEFDHGADSLLSLDPFVARFSEDRFSPFTRILSVYVENPLLNSTPIPHQCNLLYARNIGQQVFRHSWEGFAALTYYLRED